MIQDELLIRADPAVVWALTVDVEGWPGLTPTITEVTRLDDGPLAVGSRASVKQPRQPRATWTVSRVEPGRLFEWWTKVGPVTMTGRHVIEPAADGCTNHLTLDVSGPLAGLVERLVGRRIGEAIATENRGFKQAAEAIRPPVGPPGR